MEEYMKLIRADVSLYPSTYIYFEYKLNIKRVKKHVILSCNDIQIKRSGYGSLEEILNEAFEALSNEVFKNIMR